MRREVGDGALAPEEEPPDNHLCLVSGTLGEVCPGRRSVSFFRSFEKLGKVAEN